MQNLYFVVEKELQQSCAGESVEETTGIKIITVYEVDTQCMNLVEVCQIESMNESNSEEEIYTYLENNGNDNEYNLIKL